jgi:hypothetical protein
MRRMQGFHLLLLAGLLSLSGAASCGFEEARKAGERAAGDSEKPERSDASSGEQRPATTQAAPATDSEATGLEYTEIEVTEVEDTGSAEETQATGESGRLTEEEGGFSFVPPEGWAIIEIPGLKFRTAAGPSSDGFAPNINIVDEPFGGSLDEYSEINITTMEQVFEDFDLISEEDFETDDGERAVRIAGENVQQGDTLRQTYYLFDAGDTKLVVTCSRLADAQEEADAACDESMETFQIEPR